MLNDKRFIKFKFEKQSDNIKFKDNDINVLFYSEKNILLSENFSTQKDLLTLFNKIIINEPTKTISCERAILEVPTSRVNITKNMEPIIINKLGLVTSGILNIIFAAFTGLIPLLISNLYLFCWLKYDKNIPDTDIIGTIKEYK